MTSVSEARGVVRSRIEGAGLSSGGSAVPLRWQNEDGGPLPDVPAPFIYTEFLAERGQIAGFGGGRGNNLYRHPARIEAFVFVPKGVGLTEAEAIGEQLAALFRSYRDQHISCFDATVYPGGDGADLKPAGLDSEVGNYFWAGVEVSLFFDRTG